VFHALERMTGMTKTTLALLLSLSACVDLDDDLPEDTLGEVEQESHSTSASSLPNQIVLAKLDDAAATSVLQYTGNRLFANRADLAGTPVLHHYFHSPIIQLVVGDFSLAGAREKGRDQVCARLADTTLQCYAPSDDRSELWYWFAQLWPLTAAETPIVGDFTGDGADDILAFNATTGSLRLFDRTTTGTFTQKVFSLGNLASHDLRGKKLYAGEFGQSATRTDLLVVDPVNNTVARFDSVTESSTGRTTFWWAFTTGTNTLGATEQVTVANLEGGSRDGLLLRNPSTGALRAMRVEWGSGYLAPIPSTTLALGQLPVTTHVGTFAAVRLVDHSSEPNGANRDDTLFFDRTDNKIVETSARHDGTRMTYWWGWSKPTPVLSWVSRASKMALVMCKLNDHRTFEPDAEGIKRRVIGVNTGSIRDFLHEVTYGTMDIKNADVFQWVQGSLNAADSSARVEGGHSTVEYIADCMEAAGITSAQYGGRVLVVLNADNSSMQGPIGYGATVEFDNLLAGELSVVAHEMLHAFGLDHAHDDSGNTCAGGNYCDTSDIMGNFNPTWFVNAAGYRIGPGLNAMNLDRLGVVPPARIVELAAPTSSQSRTVTLAAIERPEANGALYVKVRTSSTRYFTIALRHNVNYDRLVPLGVQIHEMDPASSLVTTLHTFPTKTLLPGHTGFAGGYFVTVNAFDPVKKTATITLAH
jgi:hypothetical protein